VFGRRKEAGRVAISREPHSGRPEVGLNILLNYQQQYGILIKCQG